MIKTTFELQKYHAKMARERKHLTFHAPLAIGA
jgi:hypothetical protein